MLSKYVKHVLLILIAITVLSAALGNAAISAARSEAMRVQSSQAKMERDVGAAPVFFKPIDGVFLDNKTHAVFLFSTACPACEDNTNRSIKESYLTWLGNLSYDEVSLNIINYYRQKDIGEAYFNAFNIPRNQTTQPVLVVHNSRVGLLYYPPFENVKIQKGLYYLTRGSLVETVEKKGETTFSRPLIYALGTLSGFNPCLVALASFFFASATQTEVRRVAKRIGLISLGMIYAYIVFFSLIISNPAVMGSLEASAWLIASILAVVGVLHFLEVAQDLYSRRRVDGSYAEAKLPLFRTPKVLKRFLLRVREINIPGLDFALGIVFSLVKLPCIAIVFFVMLITSATPLLDAVIFTLGVASPLILMGILIAFGMININRLSAVRFKGRLIQRAAIGAALLISAALVIF